MVRSFEHKAGVVQKIDENTQQLATAISDGVPIIISTIQKFPFITQAIQTLAKKGKNLAIDTKDRRFAIIVDEAHSSQTGETATELRKILNQEGIEAAIASQLLEDEADEDLSDTAKQELIRQQLTRTKQPNLSYFAFTATPKHRTLLVFDEPGVNGSAPFHLYTMRQAIEEGFIKDVLANYTCYQRYYELVRLAENDPDLPRSQAAKAIARFIELHVLNERFGTDFTLADQLFFEQIHETAIAFASLQQAARINTKENFAPVLSKYLEKFFIERMEGNEKIFIQFMNNEEFKKIVFEKLLSSIYDSINHQDSPA
jgi:hypothetical protein